MRVYLLLGFIIASILSLCIGAHSFSLFQPDTWTAENLEILLLSRIPRLLSIIIAGISLSVSGLIMQSLTRNKFVEPTTAGTMDAAKLGILVSLLLFTGASLLEKMMVSFLFALGGTFLFMTILRRVKMTDQIFIPLVGLLFGNVISSITTFFAYKHDLIQNIGSWMQGDFSMVVAGQYELIYISIPLVIVAYFYAHSFTVAGMGESFATNLGISYKSVIRIGLTIVSLISVVVILTVGTVPFLGLVVPNLVSLYRGDHLQKSLLDTALLGAVFLLLCDILGRIIIYPYEISIGLMVGVIGSGMFLYLLLRRRTNER